MLEVTALPERCQLQPSEENAVAVVILACQGLRHTLVRWQCLSWPPY